MIPIRPPHQPAPEIEYHRYFITASLALGLGIGFVLAVLVPLSRAISWGLESARPDLVEVHGQVQLWGLLGLFVMGMAFRLMPRFAHTPLCFVALVGPILVLVVVSLLSRALVVIWLPTHAHNLAAVGVAIVLLVAAVYFALIVWTTLLASSARDQAMAWFMLGGSCLLAIAALAGTLATLRELRDRASVLPYLPDAASVYLFLGGFGVAFIGGVSSRALPAMVGLKRNDHAGRVVAVSLTTAACTLAGSLLSLEFVSYEKSFILAADISFIALGTSWAGVVWLSGVLRPVANRVRSASQPHMRLVRSAFVWLALAAGFAVYLGAAGIWNGALPSEASLDALRHALGLGTATMLIVGMALLILPEFAGERLMAPDQSKKSFLLLVFLNVATVLRVGYALFAAQLSGESLAYLQATAGALAELALIVLAWDFLRLMRPSAR